MRLVTVCCSNDANNITCALEHRAVRLLCRARRMWSVLLCMLLSVHNLWAECRSAYCIAQQKSSKWLLVVYVAHRQNDSRRGAVRLKLLRLMLPVFCTRLHKIGNIEIMFVRFQSSEESIRQLAYCIPLAGPVVAPFFNCSCLVQQKLHRSIRARYNLQV